MNTLLFNKICNDYLSYFNQQPKPGDLIEIFRGIYQHWAIYVGDDYVVHLAPPSEYKTIFL